MALNRSSLHHTAAGAGGINCGFIKGKRTLNIWRLPAADLVSSELFGTEDGKVCIDLPKGVAEYSFAP